MKQLTLFPDWDPCDIAGDSPNLSQRQQLESKFSPSIREELKIGKLVSYVGNKNLPILRLYRYKEAFSFALVKEFIERFQLNAKKDYLFEPFCGLGTTPFTAMQYKIPAIAIDRLPIATFVASTLPLFSLIEPNTLRETFAELRSKVDRYPPADVALDVKVMKIAFPEEMLLTLRRWKAVIHTLSEPLRQIYLLLFLSILEPCSYTAKDGQFLRMKPDKRLPDPAEILQQKVYEAEQDLLSMRQLWGDRKPIAIPQIQPGDARNLDDAMFKKAPTAIITSPPYPNRYDYTRSYSLELCFNFVNNFEELKKLRFGILRSHIEVKVDANEQPTHHAIQEVVHLLHQQGKYLNNPRIPDMLTAYFVDMRQVIGEWYRVLAPGGKVAMVVDNVRFAGEMVPVDLILSEMAEELGFKVQEIIVARYKGNSSQQMGKYGRVPVRESIVIWQKYSETKEYFNN